MSRTKTPAEQAGFLPERPWRRNPNYVLGLYVGNSPPNASELGIGWAALESGGTIEEGEHALPPGATEDQIVAETALLFKKLQRRRMSGRDDGAVVLWRYTKKTFPQSRAFHEGMSLASHTRVVNATRAALEAEGIEVKIRFSK